MAHVLLRKTGSWFLALAAAFLLLSCAVPAPARAGGSCGENLTWEMDGGVLTISGEGEMFSFAEKRPDWNRRAVRRLVIEPGVTGIGALAFDGCILLEEAEIPDTVTRIGDFAFSRCFLKSVRIPGSVTEIGANPFVECGALEEIAVDPDHPALSFRDGMLVSRADGRLVCLLKACAGQDCVIPAGTRIIGDYAFAYCENLRSVTVPDGVTAVGRRAFAGCGELRSLALPDSAVSVGSYAFSRCVSLESLAAGNALESIGSCAFSGCKALKEIVLPDSLTAVGDSPFEGCESLAAVRAGDACPALRFENGMLISRPDGRLLFYTAGNPAETCAVPEGTAAVGRRAFMNGSALKRIVLPGSVREIGREAFTGCTGTEEVVLSEGLETIGTAAFREMEALREIVLPEGLKTIGDEAFLDCAALERVTLPESAEQIGREIFLGVDRLNLAVFAAEGSPADEYCSRNGLRTVRPGQEIPEPAAEMPPAFTEQYPGCRGLYRLETWHDDEAVFLARTAEGTLVLLCGTDRGGDGWTVVESMPLPAESRAVLDRETLLLDLGYARCAVCRYHDDVWGISFTGQRELYFGPKWIGYDPIVRDMTFGIHPWADLTAIDWISLSEDSREVMAALDTSACAIPYREDPNGRTPVRAEPDENSVQIAGLFNGAPLFAAERQGDWTRVCLGRDDGTAWRLDGWVRTEDLLFDSTGDLRRRPDIDIAMAAREKDVTLVTPLGNIEIKGYNENGENFIVVGDGVIGGREYWLVYSCYTEQTGFVLKSALFGGNG